MHLKTTITVTITKETPNEYLCLVWWVSLFTSSIFCMNIIMQRIKRMEKEIKKLHTKQKWNEKKKSYRMFDMCECVKALCICARNHTKYEYSVSSNHFWYGTRLRLCIHLYCIFMYYIQMNKSGPCSLPEILFNLFIYSFVLDFLFMFACRMYS